MTTLTSRIARGKAALPHLKRLQLDHPGVPVHRASASEPIPDGGWPLHPVVRGRTPIRQHEPGWSPKDSPHDTRVIIIPPGWTGQRVPPHFEATRWDMVSLLSTSEIAGRMPSVATFCTLFLCNEAIARKLLDDALPEAAIPRQLAVFTQVHPRMNYEQVFEDILAQGWDPDCQTSDLLRAADTSLIGSTPIIALGTEYDGSVTALESFDADGDARRKQGGVPVRLSSHAFTGCGFSCSHLFLAKRT
jgi:hypothetical protein